MRNVSASAVAPVGLSVLLDPAPPGPPPEDGDRRKHTATCNRTASERRPRRGSAARSYALGASPQLGGHDIEPSADATMSTTLVRTRST